MEPKEIVTAVQFQDHIYIFCRHGQIYKMYIDYMTGQLTFQLEHRL